MQQIEKVIRKVKGEEKEVEFIFCDGIVTANPPEIKIIGTGYKVLRGFGFSLRVNNGRNKKPTYYALEFWGNDAENFEKLGFEGQRIIVSGRLDKSTYTNTKGETKETLTIKVERFSCIDYKISQDKVEEINEDNVEESIQSPNQLENNPEISTKIEEVEVKEINTDPYDDLPF